MGFNVSNIDKTSEVFFLDEFQKAEQSGLTRVIIRKPPLMEYEVMLGQIFLYKDGYHHEGDPSLTHVWKLIDGKPHTIREKVRGGFVEDEPGELIFEIHEGDYLPKKDKYFTKNEMHDAVDKCGKGLWKERKFLINKDADYGRIKSIEICDVEDEFLTGSVPKQNPHKEWVPRESVKIVIEREISSTSRIDVNNPIFEDNNDETFIMDLDSKTFDKFEANWFIIEDNDLVGFESKVKQARLEGSLDAFGDQIMIGTSDEEKMHADMGKSSSALMGIGNNVQLQLLHDRIYVKNQLSTSVQYSFKRIMVIQREEMERALDKEREAMELMKVELENQIAIFKKQMKKITRLITTLEIYLGESENLIQMAEGEKAPDTEPISLRQMMLYMDEEFADYQDGGLDFESLDKFDEWLVESGTFKTLIPELKGVVVMRPRRFNKRYPDLEGKNDIFAAMERQRRNALNRKFYLLIRNGDNLYKIDTDKIDFGLRLFPLKEELQGMMDTMSEATMKMNEEELGSYSYKSADDKFERAGDEMFFYQRNFLLLQGIIMRTDVFAPIPPTFNFLDVTTHGDTVQFIYDEENILMDGKLRFWDYHKQINESIAKGSRITVTGYGRVGDYHDRFNFYISDRMEYNLETPEAGLYTVKSRIIERRSHKVIWIPLTEWKAHEKNHTLMEEKHKVVSKSGSYETTTYDLPSDYFRKYDDARRTRREDDGSESRQVYELIDGKRQEVNGDFEQLYISYNYMNEYTDKKVHKTFIIYPYDTEVINYDALVLEDLQYYISNRIDRPNYLKMMPLLFELRDELKKEKAHEVQFVEMTKSEILRDYPTLNVDEVEKRVWDAVEWWKNTKATVWKRPIAQNDAKALEMIVRRVKSEYYKSGSKTVTKTVPFKETLLIWKFHDWTFYAFGMGKSKFISEVDSIRKTQPRFFLRKVTGWSKIHDEVRSISNARSENEIALLETAKKDIGNVQFI